LNPAADTLIFSTFLRGSDRDVGTSIDVARIPRNAATASKYEIYVTGHTSSLDFFPMYQSVRDQPFNEDIFVTKLVQLKGAALDEADAELCRFPTPGVSELPQTGCRIDPTDDGQAYSVLIGGEDSDFSYGIAAAPVYTTATTTGTSLYVALAGGTFSTDYPLTATAIPNGSAFTSGQIDDAFITTLTNTGFGSGTDLEARFVNTDTKSIRPGASITYTVEINNLSGTTATNTRLAVLYPVSMSVVSIPSNCNRNGLLIYCDTGDLGSATSNTQQVSMTFSARFATNVTMRAIASSEVADDDLSNNSKTALLTVVNPPNRGALSLWALAIFMGFFVVSRRFRPSIH